MTTDHQFSHLWSESRPRAACPSGPVQDAACRRQTAPAVAAAQRSEQPLSGLRLALQCGGSDGYSGITANPAMGAAVDLLVRHGGSAILAETPEIYGAEHLLTRRAASREVGERLG